MCVCFHPELNTKVLCVSLRNNTWQRTFRLLDRTGVCSFAAEINIILTFAYRALLDSSCASMFLFLPGRKYLIWQKSYECSCQPLRPSQNNWALIASDDLAHYWIRLTDSIQFSKQYYVHSDVLTAALDSCWLASPSSALLPSWMASFPFRLLLCIEPIEIPGTGSHSFACHINLAPLFPRAL